MKLQVYALTSVAQLVGHCPADQKVCISIPGQSTCLGCGFGPQLGSVQEGMNQCFSLSLMFLPLSFSPLPLSLGSIKKT